MENVLLIFFSKEFCILQIIANLDPKRHGHLLAYIMCSQFNTPKPIHLIIDTGSSNTTLLSDDVTRLSINCTILQLSPIPSLTASGTIIPFLLPDVQLLIEVRHGWFNQKRNFGVFHLASIHCMPPTHPQLMTQQRILHACSLLGMDILRLFKKWQFTENKLILKT